MVKTIKFWILLLSLSSTVHATGLRGEIQRYTLLHDRAMIDRNLRSRPYQDFIVADFIISSGLKDLVGDISDGTEDSQSTVQKQLNMFELLSKYVNTEQFVDLDIVAGLPLPKVKIKKWRFYNSAFYHLNMGVMATISNQTSVTDPTAQTYVKKDTKIGINSTLKRKKNEDWYFSLYQLSRSDLSASLNSSSLATDGELFDFDKLNDEHQMFALDLAYKKNYEKYFLLAEFRELKLKTSKKVDTLYGTKPLFHLKAKRILETEQFHLKPFVGFHYRRWYNLMRGLYAGIDFKYKKLESLRFIFKASNQFFLINPMVEFKYFVFSYAYKSPFRNPQDDIWVPGMHNIILKVPFP